jgi:predicted anti-sigma-YlaC factor YlaD
MSTTDMTCRELVEALTSYLEGAMAPDARARLEAHLAGCEGCTNAMTQLRETIRIAGRLSEDEVAKPEREAVRRIFMAWRRELRA